MSFDHVAIKQSDRTITCEPTNEKTLPGSPDGLIRTRKGPTGADRPSVQSVGFAFHPFDLLPMLRAYDMWPVERTKSFFWWLTCR